MTVFFRVSSGDLSQEATQLRYKTKSPPEIPKAPQSIRSQMTGVRARKVSISTQCSPHQVQRQQKQN